MQRMRRKNRTANPERLTPSAAAEASRTRRINLLVDYSSAILLALVAVVTAWTGYQATLFNGQAGSDTRQLTQVHSQVTRAESLADQQMEIDLILFIAWLNAFATDQTELTDFYEARMRDEFAPSFNAWIATQPRSNPDAPTSPFVMEEYKLASRGRAQELQQQEAELIRAIETANEQGDAYLYTSVLFALVLFFVSVAQRFEMIAIRVAVELTGVAVFLWAMVRMLSLPIMQ